ncbi:hypothetical protein AB9N12_03020 [Bacteroides sp. AN502(2024)]|uniref:hypothetical protein n=1 Tax=Bacteroides sp. AN502(2024) TaxID=3160599 RepID=UPI003516EB81
MNKEFQNDGDRLKEELTKSIGERVVITLVGASNRFAVAIAPSNPRMLDLLCCKLSERISL